MALQKLSQPQHTSPRHITARLKAPPIPTQKTTYRRTRSMEKDLMPDKPLLDAIFADTSLIVNSVYMLASRPQNCTFKVRLAQPTSPKLVHTMVIVRVEIDVSKLDNVARFEDAARTQLGELIPASLGRGRASMKDGKEVAYSVTELVDEAMDLEDVWTELSEEQKEEVVDQVVAAVARMQRVPGEKHLCGDGEMPQVLLPYVGGTINGNHLGVEAFLKRTASSLKVDGGPVCRVFEDGYGSLRFKSIVPGFDDVLLTVQDFDILNEHVVLCHKDLMPRNILVREVTDTADWDSKFQLAAIIDWETAAWVPYAVEYAIVDANLGIDNFYYDWYRMMRDRTRHLLPECEATKKLMLAVQLIHENYNQLLSHDFNTEVRRRWLHIQQLEYSPDVIPGWMRKEGAPERPYSEEELNEIEDEVRYDLRLNDESDTEYESD